MSGHRPRVVIVCGSCDATGTHELQIIDVLQRLRPTADDVFLHGAARGVDTMAANYLKATSPWPVVIPMRAQWATQGESAGPRRNREMRNVAAAMASCGYDPLVVAFPLGASRGTRHMMRLGGADGWIVQEHPLHAAQMKVDHG